MTALIVVGWILGWVLLWRAPRLRSARGGVLPTRVSVVVPMRNEVERIPLLLASLLGQTRRPDQVIVVDDASEDGSAEAVRAFPEVELLTAGPVPTGWTGKSWACATGARRARGEVLVFLDADVVLGEEALDQILATWSADGGLVSVQPHHRTQRPFESASLMFNVIAVMGLGIGSLVPPRHEWGAAGPCLATSRADYDRVGGHGAVAGDVAEDLALARAYREVGLPIRCFGGGRQIGFRMYRNPRDLFQGWAKNVATGARRTPLVRAFGVAIWVSALISMLLVVLSPPGWLAFGLVYAAASLQLGVLGSRVGRFGPAAVAWPLLVVVFIVIFACSVVQTAVLRRARWSGRSIPLHRHG
jgi:hypothetical protein